MNHIKIYILNLILLSFCILLCLKIEIMYGIHKLNESINVDRRWSWSLDSELKSYRNSGYNGIIISRETQNDKRQFRWFHDINRFYNEYIKLRPSQRIFHEIITDRYQKMRFDIDCTGSEIIAMNKSSSEAIQMFADTTFNKLREVLQKYITIDKSDLMIFSSNSSLENKFSMHIILTNYYFADARTCNHIFKEFIKLVPEKLINYYDHGVYRKNQGFRLIESTKRKSIRLKKYVKLDGYYAEEEISESKLSRQTFLDSLNTICDGLYIYIELPQIFETKYLITQMEAEHCLSLLVKAGIYCYKIGGIADGCIVLLRKSRSFCKLCRRLHTSENAFCVKYEDGYKFYCRRNSTKFLPLGVTINNEDDEAQKLRMLEAIKSNSKCVKSPNKNKDHNTQKLRMLEAIKSNSKCVKSSKNSMNSVKTYEPPKFINC